MVEHLPEYTDENVIKFNRARTPCDERFCDKCHLIVHKSDFNDYYKICNKCVNNSTGH